MKKQEAFSILNDVMARVR